MKVAITGVSGLLGAHVAAAFRDAHEVAGIDRNDWWGDWPLRVLQGDLRDEAFLSAAVESIRPDVLIHCAGMIDVDACERDPDQAFQYNAGVAESLRRAVPDDCLFVYISTDSVFNGLSFPTEEREPSPANVYAQTKLQGEVVASKHAQHLIVRTNFYGWSSGRKKTAGEWLYGALKNGDAITLFEDFFFTPIYVGDLAALLPRMIDAKARGLFHVAGRDRVSKFDFGTLMAQAMNASMDHVRRGKIALASLGAPRSSDISLSSAKLERFLGMRVPTCQQGIDRFLSDREQPLSRRVGND